MQTAHRTVINSLLDGRFGFTFGIINFGQIIICHPKHTRGSIHTEMTPDTDILLNKRASRHAIPSFSAGLAKYTV
jgi:hypothetical protein